MSNPTPASPRWRVIACDLDGTLLGRHDHVNPEDLAALRRARAAGLHIAICTGRNSNECGAVIDALNLQGLGVFTNGAAVCDMATTKIMHSTFLPVDVVEPVVDFFGGMGHAVLAMIDNEENRLPRYVLTNHAPPHRATQEWLRMFKSHPQVVSDFNPVDRRRILRLNIVVNPADKHSIERELAGTFGDRVAHHSVYSGVFDCQVIETFAPNVNKWTGIVNLCNAMGLDPAAAVALGDDVNDIAMLRHAALSFAMGNANDTIKAIAKHVTAAQSDHGVAQVIDEILAGKWG
jgi:Cof subfamily protein (haloacid dehalogenase superfamily)